MSKQMMLNPEKEALQAWEAEKQKCLEQLDRDISFFIDAVYSYVDDRLPDTRLQYGAECAKALSDILLLKKTALGLLEEDSFDTILNNAGYLEIRETFEIWD